jgi:DNA-binding NarL/FixJ family response regulator
MKRIYIIDDHKIMRQSYALLLSRHVDFELCGEAASATEALAQLASAKPDLVIVDVSLPDMDGVELLRILRSQMPELRILMISGHTDRALIDGLLARGAHGYLAKEQAPQRLLTAVEQVLNGQIYRYHAY